MAKESMKARERKRQRIVAKYAAKRKSLKEANDYLVFKSFLKMPHQLDFIIDVS